MRPACHAGWPQRHLWAGSPWQRTAETPERDRFQDVLTREPASQIPVEGMAVAEGRQKAVLPRDHGSEASVEGVSVAEGRFEGGLTRGDATDAPVGRGAVSEEGK